MSCLELKLLDSVVEVGASVKVAKIAKVNIERKPVSINSCRGIFVNSSGREQKVQGEE